MEFAGTYSCEMDREAHGYYQANNRAKYIRLEALEPVKRGLDFLLRLIWRCDTRSVLNFSISIFPFYKVGIIMSGGDTSRDSF